MSDQTPDPDGVLTIERSGWYRVASGQPPRALQTYQAALELFETNQTGAAVAEVTLDELRKLCLKAQRIVVDDLARLVRTEDGTGGH